MSKTNRTRSHEAIAVPVKVVARCEYCRTLLGEKRHPMLPERPVSDHCTCELVVSYEYRGGER